MFKSLYFGKYFWRNKKENKKKKGKEYKKNKRKTIAMISLN